MSPEPYLRAVSQGSLQTSRRSSMRWLAVLCALLFVAITTAQAAHVHQPARSGHHLQAPAATSQLADTEEHCPLCVAMHATVPEPLLLAPVPAIVSSPLLRLTLETRAGPAWHFPSFSRPPPVRA